jgi:mannose/fructose/N-acetylgalactosamine-specific phosphotransferase system component IIB
MWRVVTGLAFISVLSATVAFGEVSKDTLERVQQANARAEKLSAGKVAEYAKEYLEAAKLSIFMAQAAGASGNEKLALQHTDMAQLQMTVAEAKAGQKELSEEVALSRAELKRLEGQLERYMQPEEK